MRQGCDAVARLNDARAQAALVAAAQRGEESAFEMLVENHRRRVFAVAMRYTRVFEDAEDIVQQTLQKAFVYLHRFEGKSSFNTWLTRIAINESLMLLRRTRPVREIPINDRTNEEGTEPRLELVDTRPDPEATYLHREAVQALAAGLQGLKRETRAVIELHELQELSTRDTARRVGLSVPAVKSHLLRGKRKLRNKLKHRMGSQTTRCEVQAA
jgi:RNA polymerase sigma-70 factor, ECF subfamily